jgi:SAM-dependent methyltransferase
MPEWFENEALWRDLYPYLFPPERFEAAREEVTSVLELTGFPGKRVLDLCCGPGRHSAELAMRGYEVTGVDRSPYLLERGQARAADLDADVEWVLDDMRSFRRPGTYGLAVNLFTSFGYTTSEADDLRVLRNVRESLVPGGSLVMEMMGKEVMASIYSRVGVAEPGDGSRLFMVRDVEGDWSAVSNLWVLVRDGEAREYSFRHRIYSARELRGMLEEAGFRRVRLYGGLDGSAYGPGASRLVAVAATPDDQQEGGSD